MTADTHSGETGEAPRRDPTVKNVVLLALSSALSMTGGSLVMTVTALTGAMLATGRGDLTLLGLALPYAALSTLALTAQFVGTMASTIPASLMMRRTGRRLGFTIGQSIGIAGAALSVHAIFQNDFWLFVAGGFVLGMHNAFWQYYRFAAADTASPAFKPKAISFVMAGPVLAAILGPELAKRSIDIFDPILFAGAYAVIGVLCVATIAVLQFIEIPKPPRRSFADTGRPLGIIARQPRFIVAILSAMIGYAMMSLVMTATPLAIVACGFDFNDSAFVIQWHALGMFLPSFFTGILIARFGALSVIKAGVLLNLGCVGFALSGVALAQFWAALVLLGVGWNFMFVGGTALLTETYRPEEKEKVQAMNDFCVFTLVAISSLSAGALHYLLGWAAVNLAIVLPMLLAFAAALWLRFSDKPAPAQ